MNVKDMPRKTVELKFYSRFPYIIIIAHCHRTIGLKNYLALCSYSNKESYSSSRTP
jgi:hypothetical protein